MTKHPDIPYHAERQAGAKIEVTPEMIGAGLEVLRKSGLVDDLMGADNLLVEEIFLAMVSKFPEGAGACEDD